MEELKHLWDAEVKLKGGILNVVLMRDSNGSIVWSGLFMVYVMPILSMYIFHLIMKSAFEPEENAKELAMAIEIKNEFSRR